MRTLTILFCVVGIMLLTSLAAAEDVSLPDTLSIEKVVASKAGQFAVKVNFVNDESLAAITIPLILEGKGATIDSVSFAGSRVAYLSMRPVTITEDRQRIIFGAIQFTENDIAPGRGLLATIYISLTDPGKTGTIGIDTATFGTTSLLFTRPDSRSFEPQFVPGSITINGTEEERMPPPDSLVTLEIAPVQVYTEQPEYPRLAKEGGHTAEVVIQAFVDSAGAVKKAQAVKCSAPGMGFEEAAIKAAYKCRYKPAIQKGRPIGAWISYKVDFKLK